METIIEKTVDIEKDQPLEASNGENSALFDLLESLNQCTHE
jgi:hypothetical protein